MGVEYKHFLIPSNPSFVPLNEVFTKIDEVFTRYNLRTGDPIVYDLGSGSKTTDRLADLKINNGFGLKYPEVTGIDVANLLGKSYYLESVADNNRYIDSISFIAGWDYRINWSGQELTCEVQEPPYENGEPLEAYCDFDKLLYMHSEAYHGSLYTTPPKVEIWVDDKERILGDQDFKGYWRTAICFDCGKDLPLLVNDVYKIKNRNFIRDIELALGCTIIEVGELC